MFQQNSKSSHTIRGVLHLSLNTHRFVMCSWGLPGTAGGGVQKAKTSPKFGCATCSSTSKPFFSPSPLISLHHSWLSGGPARVRMPSLKLLICTVGRENPSKAGLGSALLCCCAGGWQQWGAAPLCPFELGPWGEPCCSIPSPLSAFYHFKGNLATKPSVEHQEC